MKLEVEIFSCASCPYRTYHEPINAGFGLGRIEACAHPSFLKETTLKIIEEKAVGDMGKDDLFPEWCPEKAC